MYFKKLEIFGFKSFADKTILNFEPGITAIVGPNGCGKSNIFDAIRWVLGEQSVKELRGGSMEDVIFNGTEKKPSLGFAEVTLSFSNESKMLPIEYDEVAITRRLFRSGESEYLINKQVVRLKDIQELLMGTGIGAEAYSLVQQGKVDLVVSSRPEDRRMILDEAAGITKYKSKKKEALNKLKDTENNLLRINDIIVEVKRQIGSIERQANKARKYKEEFEKLKNYEIIFARHQINSSAEEQNKIQQQLADLKAQEQKLLQEREELHNLLNSEGQLLEELEQKINHIHSEEIKLDGQIDLNNRQIGFNEERLQNLTQNENRLSEQKQQLIDRCRQQQIKVEELKQSLMHLEKNIRLTAEFLVEKKDSLILIAKFIRDAKDKIKENEEKILNLTSKQVNARNEVTEVMKEIQGCLARKRRLDLEMEKVLSEKKIVDERLQNVDSQTLGIDSMVQSLRAQKESKQQSLSGLSAEFSRLEQTIDQLEHKKVTLTSQKEFIEKLQTQYQDIPDPVVEGRFLTSSKPLDHHTGIIGKVKGVRPISAEQLQAMGHILTSAEAQEYFEIICETKFIELDPVQISNKIEEIVKEIELLVLQKEELSGRINEQNDSIRLTDQEIQEREKSLSVLDSQKRDILEEAKKLLGELELLEVELSEVKESLTSLKAKEDELNYQLDTINQDLSWSQLEIKEKQDFITAKSQEKEEFTVAIAQKETELESDKDKIKSVGENCLHFTQTLDGWLEEIKKIDDEIVGQAAKQAQFTQEIEQLKIKIEEIKVSQESLRNVFVEYETQKADKLQRVNSVRAQMGSFEDDLEKIKQEMHRHELNLQQVTFSEQGIKNRLMQTYKIQPEDLIPKEGEAATEGINFEDLNQELALLRKRCESYGNVNLVAIEEYDELKARFEFLTKQQSDLLEAKSQLMNTISKINRTTRQMFMDTFTKVSEEFRIYFRMLFGGGEANLVLLDPENVLESGIEIVARPPGKKLQTISLLSGGEKSLTAIALVFGVFKVNPSPFCVLDEIDAALDESNVGRFSYLLKDFAKVAQFIVITHNKKTISSADVMYGITMQETGVSRIVSVKFSNDEKKKEETAVAVGA